MGKLGKKKVVEEMSRKKSEAEAKHKNGGGADDSEDGLDSKDGSSDKNDTASSLSGSSSQKQRSNQHKRKSSGSGAAVGHDGASKVAGSAGGTSKSKSKSKSIDSDSDDSDDLPLNGSKSSNSNESTGGGPPAKKPRKQAKPKSTKAATATTSVASKGKSNKNGKKKAAAAKKDSDSDGDYEDAVDDESLAKSDDDFDTKQQDGDVEMEYEVDAIIGHKKVRGASYFLIRWKGYNADSDTWEPEIDLNCDDLIAEFRKKQAISTQFGPLHAKGNSDSKIGKPKKTSSNNTGVAGKSVGKKEASSKQSSSKKSTIDDPEKEWVVERVVDFIQDADTGGLYRIRWKGFGPKDDTWEPEKNLSCGGLIEKYKRSLVSQRNVETKELRESPKKTKRLVNECYPRTNIANRIERSSKRAAAKNRVFYGEE
ncbi:chromodomain-helicase-DNA-binding protein 1 isoform X1 [Drosophila miranda]|uniref:chromodomain-helicase-DNA-binding protein 1 isoform X1 n=1 Tax=Drosophila miranda TaxID=7229 RepID=UPI0007E637EF|nr:chromodomain-helicase-DNA-binding protein 1 isoform X1 [Drosophila miranda]